MSMRTWRAAVLVLLAAPASWGQGWLVSPARQEMVIRPGEDKTFVIRVERERGPGGPGAPAERVRFTGVPGDWDISRSGEVLLATPESLGESANGWMSFSPTGFALPAGGSQQIRVTLAVPIETTPGVYRAGLFFQEHSLLPPQREDSRQVAIRYRMSTLIYVVVPPLEKKIVIESVEMRGSSKTGFSVHAVLANLGTVHLRPQHWVEVRDPAGDLLARTDPLPTMVLLPKRKLEVNLALPRELPSRSSYQIRYFLDAGRDVPLQAATLSVVDVGNE